MLIVPLNRNNRKGINMGKEEQRNLRLFVLSGIFSTIMLNLYSPFIVKFLQRLGGNEFHISLLDSLPGLIGILSSLPGAIYITKKSHKSTKNHMISFMAVSRLLILGLAIVVLFPPKIAPWLIVAILAVKSFPESIATITFQSFNGDLFEDDFRSTAISMRSKSSIPIAIVVSLLSGYILRTIPENEAERMTFYQIFFVASVLFGLFETFSFIVMKEPERKTKRIDININKILLDMRKDKKFIRFTVISLVFYIGWQMGLPLFNIYQVVNLGTDELWLSILYVFTALGSFSGYNFWNRMIQKRGNAIVASITSLGIAISPMLLAFTPNTYWAAVLFFASGYFYAGSNTVLLNYLLESTPQENRVVYIGAYKTLINISLMISPIISHRILTLTGIFWTLIIVGIIRLAGSILFYRNHIKYNDTKPKAAIE